MGRVIYVCLEGKVNIFVIEWWEEKVLFEILVSGSKCCIYGLRPKIQGPGFEGFRV